jgi:ribonucleoside-diphosphate reductase alpha chain
LALDAMSVEDRVELGIRTNEERIAQLEGDVGYGDPNGGSDDTEDGEEVKPLLGVVLPPVPKSEMIGLDAPLCVTCGVRMQPAGSCYVCDSCGSTSGCS